MKRIVMATVAFALVAPVALVALPLAALLGASRPRTTREWVVGGLAGGYAVWWLAVPGPLPDQVLRAAAVVVVTLFTVLSRRTAWTFVHRAIAAMATATVALYVLAVALGTTWEQVRWWVAREIGLSARLVIGQLWQTAGRADRVPESLAPMETWLTGMVAVAADLYPALIALQALAGLALASALYHRVATEPRGRPLGRLREFRFTEHIGWAAAVPLVVVLLPTLVAAKAAAQNVLLVAAALYGLRGLGVAAFGLHAVGAGGVLLWVFVGVAALLLLPVVLGGAIILGVVDAGVDLRRRWSPPPASE